MKFISHRGNISGPVPELENKPDYINQALNFGYEVEIDVWYVNSKFFLGHDSPKYEISLEFLKNKKLWCHLKNIEAFKQISKLNDIHWFWHEEDKLAITSKGYVIGLVGYIVQDTIVIMPDIDEFFHKLKQNITYLGVCSDEIAAIQQKILK